MNNIHAEQLTPEQIDAELQIEDTRVKLLDSALASLSKREEIELFERLTQTVAEGMRELFRALPQWNLFPDTSMLPTRIRVYFMTSEEAKFYYGKNHRRVSSGMAWSDRSTIGVIKHLALAPKEVTKSVVVHECLHILYPFAKKAELNVRNSIQRGYPPEHHQEEEWVTRMTERLCGKDDLLLGWEVAVESRGMQWKDLYYKLKKSKRLRHGTDYSYYDA